LVSAPPSTGAGRRWLWRLAGLFVAAQLLWFAGLAIWPSEAGIEGALKRIWAWERGRVFLWQIGIGAPVLVWLALGARGWLVRLLIGVGLLASALIAALCAFDLNILQLALTDGSTGTILLARMLDLTRVFETLLALAAVILVRLAARDERMMSEGASTPLAEAAPE